MRAFGGCAFAGWVCLCCVRLNACVGRGSLSLNGGGFGARGGDGVWINFIIIFLGSWVRFRWSDSLFFGFCGERRVGRICKLVSGLRNGSGNERWFRTTLKLFGI